MEAKELWLVLMLILTLIFAPLNSMIPQDIMESDNRCMERGYIGTKQVLRYNNWIISVKCR